MVKTIPSFVLGRLNTSTYQPRTPRPSNSLRPSTVKGASRRAGVGWVRTSIVLTILLMFNDDASAQLDRLRRSKALEQPSTAETPMVEIPAGEFAMGSDGGQALEDERPLHRVWVGSFSMDLHEGTTAQDVAVLSASTR